MCVVAPCVQYPLSKSIVRISFLPGGYLRGTSVFCHVGDLFLPTSFLSKFLEPLRIAVDLETSVTGLAIIALAPSVELEYAMLISRCDSSVATIAKALLTMGKGSSVPYLQCSAFSLSSPFLYPLALSKSVIFLEHLVQSVPKLGGMRPYITLSIYASLNGANVSGHASALFIGGFSIMEMSKNSMQLNLTLDCNKTSITILGNTDVEISWGRMDLIIVSPIRKEDFGIGGSAQYEVKLLNAKRFEDKITITLPANGQRVEMDISYKPVETASYMSIMNVIGWTIMVGISMLFMYKICVLMSKEVRSWQSTVPATSSNAAPSTPIRGSPVVTDEMSPRTPQPFMDYVRRTIDETPYYRREGRRINPQNTF
ncbi:nuclear pore complex protein GP210 [Senna tora]|uniref:Nuclear pore complex protein GP210 n=1 Tax=Senna tora TaxID=362788 RepID=A0A834SDJ9_9FABA|nr:nuclear pore complex protein GP210 [Senna tora]